MLRVDSLLAMGYICNVCRWLTPSWGQPVRWRARSHELLHLHTFLAGVFFLGAACDDDANAWET